MNIRACIFDLDGVIVDTAKYHYQSWRKLANTLGFDFTETQNEKLKGVSRMESLDLILEWGNKTGTDAEKEAWAAQKNEWYKSMIATLDQSEILPGVIPFLDTLDTLGIKIALASASKNAKTILAGLGITNRFQVIIDGNSFTKSKPNPECFLRAATDLEVPPLQCIVFEDAPKGVQAALAAGCYAVGVGSIDSLSHAHYVIPGFAHVTPTKIFDALSPLPTPKPVVGTPTKDYITAHPWHIIEDSFHPEYNEITESLMSLGNGQMGHRGNFEEHYSGHTLQGHYVAGVYYPDKTRVGWWKNGYPEYFGKILNAPAWIGIDVYIDDERLDLATCQVEQFQRTLDMKTGIFHRTCEVILQNGTQLRIASKRFCSMVETDLGAIDYQLTPLNRQVDIRLVLDVDADIENRDSNYDEKFWEPIEEHAHHDMALVTAETRKTAFQVCTSMKYDLAVNETLIDFTADAHTHPKYASSTTQQTVNEQDTLRVRKYAAIISSRNHLNADLPKVAKEQVEKAYQTGFDQLAQDHAGAWAQKWEEADVVIEGDVLAQQGIRFNILQLYQTYTGVDPDLNIGPKGFTGEKYGGLTYWDTEAYCLPFYMCTANSQVARNLLVYRRRQLQKAIENAQKLGFSGGAALYPMVTITGEECHNEWEITFEEIHRNGAIAYAIYDYINYTDDSDYLATYGLDVLIAISRFWAQRVNWSDHRNAYVMLGVTGPNEYENNVNNNWYTNYIARWCLDYTLESIEHVRATQPEVLLKTFDRLQFAEVAETEQWRLIINKLYLPYDDKRHVFLQQDGFLDKELQSVDTLPMDQRPINKQWSWDRILRSCFIKQADVLQGLYFFEHEFDASTIERNFDFYEPMTVHESSLSPCVHAILAASLGKKTKAYEMYARSARLDLNDYNNDTEDGLHITSMAGTWLAVVKGFGGLKWRNTRLSINPMIPEQWQSYSFKIRYKSWLIQVKVDTSQVEIANFGNNPLELELYDELMTIPTDGSIIHPIDLTA